MNNIKKIPYEISLWEDVRKYEVYREVKENGTTTQQFVIVDKPEGDTVVSSFYDERQIAIIGSNTMSSPARAIEPYFTQRVNGEIILNFSIYYRYYDEEIGKIVNNPFTNLLCNERKVKVKLQRNKYLEPEWYDFVIKDIQEDSESGMFTYTAIGLFVNELSKNGFELIFDAELESGQGTVESLGKAALEGSDWQFDKADIMVEKNIEVLYAITLNKEIKCIKTIDKTSITIPAEKTIYVFYNVLAQKSDFFQFMYFGDKPSDEVSNELLDGDGVVIDEENEYSYHIENYTGWIDNSEDELNINIPDIAKETKLEPSTIIPRGKRIVRRGLTILDPRIDEYVTIYKNDEGKRIYRYSTVKYPTSSIVQNLLVNGTNFSSSAGWESDSTFNYVLPSTGEQISDTEFGLSQCYLDFHFNEENGKILNTGIYDNRFQIDEFKAGEKYILKWERLKHSDDDDINDSFTAVLTGYKINSNTKKYEFISGEKLCEWDLKETSGQVERKIPKNLSTNVINSRVGIFFIKKKPTTTTDTEGRDVFNPVKFKEIQFFKKELDVDENIIVPGEPVESKVVTEYRYYDPAKNEDATSIEELVGVTIEPPYGYALAYDEDFNKNRAISVIESNRFNIIQTICETFECWADFKIGHEVNGKVSYIQDWEELKGKELSIGDCYFTYDNKGNLSEPQFVTAIDKEDDSFLEKTCHRRINKKDKKVGFKQYIGKDNHVGFKYGINLNSIQRNINSDQIVTKIIVKDNSNEYAKNGACSISRADDSPTKENFLFNFDYYIKQGLLSYSEITNDLYLNASQYLNYYNRLRKLNAENQSIIETQSEIRKAILVAESNLTVYQTSREEALKDYNEELADLKEYLKLSATASDKEVIEVAKKRIDVDKANNKTYSDLSAESRLMKVNMLKTKYDNYLKLEQNTRLELGIDEEGNITEIASGDFKGLKHKERDLLKQFNLNLAEKALLNKKFYEKYSRFIQEGSWISDEYMDDNLYYFDAEGVLYTSSRPQISYTINVLDLSPLEGYEAYSYQIGDKTYIEDTEFFGWKIVDYRKVPAKEEVIVSEYVMYFDNPEQNVITVQNYKTQFEDLYQRITATTNSLQFHSGEYGRAASVVQSDGTIDSGALQNSLLTTSYILENAKNQSIVWDDTGITTTNLSNANEIVRITSGAIAISNNGGETWSSAITGYGINANYIAAGSIDVSKVRIMNGKFPSFRWTSTGLDAYSFSQSEYGNYINTNFNKFVRFDQYGIYGMQGVDQDWIPNKLSDIINNDNLRFALTWDGLRIKNDDGSVQIDDKDDITVTDKNKVQRIKIGRLNKVYDDKGVLVDCEYGIRFKDASGAVTMETDDNGQLWLRNYLLVGPEDAISSQVRIGYNKDEIKVNSNNSHEVFHAGEENSNKEFIVYEDGFMKASGAEFEGTINATGGKIGNLTIDEVSSTIEGSIGIEIVSEMGTQFKVNSSGSTPTQLTLTLKPNGIVFEENESVEWRRSNDFENWSTEGLIQNSISQNLTYELFEQINKNDTCFIEAKITKNGKTYSDYITINAVRNGEKGEKGADANVYEIVTDPEEIIRYTEPKDKTSLSEGYKVGFLNNATEIRIYPYKSKEDNKILVDNIQNFEICLILYEPLNFENLTENFNDLFYIDGQNKCWVINIDKILNNNLEGYPNYPEEENEEATLFGKIKGFFGSIASSIIGIRLYKKTDFPNIEDKDFYLDDKAISKKNILIRNNYSEEMAKFYLHANNITMAIQDAGLDFSSSGLTLTNGGLEINNKGEKVFYFDEETGNLSLIGNMYAEDGYFKGELKAASGSFVGDIEANGGTIGGFTIVNNDENNYLISADKGIKLDGLNGEIIADKISIGTGATIADYIKIGDNSYIRKPSSTNEKVFIESGNVKIYDSGIIKAGKININGNDSIINIGDSNNGSSIELNGTTKTLRSDSWEITPDKAIFNNITARGSLQAATFEYGKVQTVGGILFVKASSTIKKIEGNIITVECNENSLFDVNDLCCFSEVLGMKILESSYIYKISEFINDNKVKFKLVSINEEQIDLNKIEEELNASGSSLIGSPFFKLANINNDKIEDNFAIGINSTSNDAFLPPQAISFNELIKDNQNNIYKYKTRMLLGDLKSVNHDGYGLYADNVYLEGRLISQDSQNRLTAGINSKGQGKMPDTDENYPWYNNGGKIILWGGSLRSSDATDAKFRVDDKGNLYASSGYFEGAIITNSIIEAAEIRTATISGIGENKYGLILKDLKNGICFKGTDSNSNENIYFNLSNEDFETKDLNINFSFTSNNSKLSINENGLNFDNIAKLGNIQIYKSKIGLDAISDLSKNSFEFKNDAFSIYDNIVKYKEGEGLKTNQTFSFSNKLFFDTNNGKTYMESYISESSTKGYDLYITE